MTILRRQESFAIFLNQYLVNELVRRNGSAAKWREPRLLAVSHMLDMGTSDDRYEVVDLSSGFSHPWRRDF